MPFAIPTGSVFLDGIQFSTNPAVYRPFEWKKRFSVHMAIGGLVTIQDFAAVQRDLMVRLQSGEGQFLDQATVIELHARFRTKGITYTLTDWLDNEFDVFIEEFVPDIFKIDLYNYAMLLHVLTIVKLWGTAYTGP